MADHPWLAILKGMWALSPDATALERMLAWRPTTGDGWRFRAKKLMELRQQAEPTGDGNPATTS
jgi:hypothetical protein